MNNPLEKPPLTMSRHLKETFVLAWPIVLNHLGHIMMGIIDSVMVGQLGPVPLAGLAFALSLFTFCMILFMGFGAAISVYASSFKAAQKTRDVAETYRHGLWLHLIFSILVALAVQTFLIDHLEIFSQTPEVNEAAREYLPIVLWSLVPVSLFLASRQFAEGLGYPRLPMFLMYAGLGLNALLNWLLIFGNFGFPELGLEGAAIGTFVTRVLMCLSLLIIPYFIAKFRVYLPYQFFRGLSWRRMLEICKLGIPSGAQYGFEFAAFAGAALMMGWLGTVPLAAHHIAINIAGFTFMFALGTSTAALIRVSSSLAHSDFAEARRAGSSAVLLVCVVMSALGIAFVWGRYFLAQIYVDDPEVIRLAANFLIIAGFFQLFDGAQGVLIGALRGAKDVRIPTFITFAAYWLFSLPLGYALAFHYELEGYGIWLGLAFGLMGSSLCLGIRFYIVTARKEEPLQFQTSHR